jgi:hypothetical protein
VAVDPAGFCKLKFLIQSSDGRTVYPGMEAFLTGTPSKAQLDDHAADIASAWSGGFAGYMSDHWTFTGLRLLYSDGTAVIEGDATASTTGSITSAGLPDSVCVVTHYDIESYYRGGKPRTYWPFGAVSVMGSHHTWDPGFIGDVETSIQDFIDTVDALTNPGVTTFTLGCIRRVAAGIPITPPSFYAYTGSRTDLRICTQRRRLGPL